MKPKKDFRIQRNGDSIAVFEAGGYVGSVSLRWLCGYLRDRKRLMRMLKQDMKANNKTI